MPRKHPAMRITLRCVHSDSLVFVPLCDYVVTTEVGRPFRATLRGSPPTFRGVTHFVQMMHRGDGGIAEWAVLKHERNGDGPGIRRDTLVRFIEVAREKHAP
jgi:hypothetical protein